MNQRFDGNVAVTGSLLKGDGTNYGTTKTVLGQGTFYYDGAAGHVEFSNTSSFNYQDYDLILFTMMGSLFVFLSSAQIENNNGVKACCSMIVDNSGTTNIVKAKLTKISANNNNLQVNIAGTGYNFNYDTNPYGILIGVKL